MGIKGQVVIIFPSGINSSLSQKKMQNFYCDTTPHLSMYSWGVSFVQQLLLIK